MNETSEVAVPQQDDYAVAWEQTNLAGDDAVPVPRTPPTKPSGDSRVGRLPAWLRAPALRLARVWRPMPGHFERTDLRSVRI